jgi:GTP-binding protein
VKFIDEAMITVQSGNGGSGCVSFRRERHIPRGGPDGGDGGRGGDVIMVSSPGKRTLYDFRHKKNLKAQNGSNGQGKNKTGKAGENLIVEIPTGTLVSDVQTNQIIKDFTEPGERVIIANGGRGGLGNARFKTSTHRTPRFAQPGEPGEKLEIKLDLKLIADIGLIGLPNAGKSTLISRISAANPKIGDYPFTTLTPNLGVVEPPFGEPFVVADIPGLIEGAHTGAGLGIKFLRHVERTRILVHMIDTAAIDPSDILGSFNIINTELWSYSTELAGKPQLIVLNKMDVTGAKETADKIQSALKDKEVLRISAVTGKGVKQLLARLVQILDDINNRENNMQF